MKVFIILILIVIQVSFSYAELKDAESNLPAQLPSNKRSIFDLKISGYKGGMIDRVLYGIKMRKMAKQASGYTLKKNLTSVPRNRYEKEKQRDIFRMIILYGK